MNNEPTVATKTTLQQLQEEVRKEYAHEFGGPVLKNGRMAQFLDSLIEKAYAAGKEEGNKEVEKAYGGCRACYGKGYATQKAYYHGSADFIGDKSYDWAAFPYIPCSKCERGKQIGELIEAARTNKSLD